MCYLKILTQVNGVFLLTLYQIRVLAHLGCQKGEVLPYQYDKVPVCQYLLSTTLVIINVFILHFDQFGGLYLSLMSIVTIYRFWGNAGDRKSVV